MTAKGQDYWKYSKESISSVNPKEAKYKELASSVQKAYEENKKNTKQTNVGSKSTKVFSGATDAAGNKVTGLGGMSASTTGMLGSMGSMSLTAGGNLQSAGSSTCRCFSIRSLNDCIRSKYNRCTSKCDQKYY